MISSFSDGEAYLFLSLLIGSNCRIFLCFLISFLTGFEELFIGALASDVCLSVICFQS
jgi:hypothetical protein